jgi:hypothetical protein
MGELTGSLAPFFVYIGLNIRAILALISIPKTIIKNVNPFPVILLILRILSYNTYNIGATGINYR